MLKRLNILTLSIKVMIPLVLFAMPVMANAAVEPGSDFPFIILEKKGETVPRFHDECVIQYTTDGGKHSVDVGNAIKHVGEIIGVPVQYMGTKQGYSESQYIQSQEAAQPEDDDTALAAAIFNPYDDPKTGEKVATGGNIEIYPLLSQYPQYTTSTLRHEIGHIFGLAHEDKVPGLMSTTEEGQFQDFTEWEKQALRFATKSMRDPSKCYMAEDANETLRPDWIEYKKTGTTTPASTTPASTTPATTAPAPTSTTNPIPTTPATTAPVTASTQVSVTVPTSEVVVQGTNQSRAAVTQNVNTVTGQTQLAYTGSKDARYISWTAGFLISIGLILHGLSKNRRQQHLINNRVQY